MVFQVGSKIDDFSGQVDLNTVLTSAAVADNDFSVAGDLDIFTNSDSARTSEIVLSCSFVGVPNTHSSILVFVQQLNIDGGTGDQPVPNSGYLHDLVASIPVNGATGLQLVTSAIKMRNVKANQPYQFYIWNRTGQTISAAWTILVTPTAEGTKQ